MNFRTLMLAGAATALLATPALAGEGWYLGLGAGWDHLNDPTVVGSGIHAKLHAKSSAIVAATFGYKFAEPFRVEFETAWDRHKTDSFTAGGVTFDADGHAEVRSVMLNGLYDIPVLPRLKISIGAGAGVGSGRIKSENPSGVGHFSIDGDTHFMYQGIGGITYSLNPNFDLFVDYHYRHLNDGSSDIAAPFASRHALTEHVVMAGFRWYPAAEEYVAAEPPPPPPPPPPPVPPPAAVKTFIVFFDFNKSNLSAEAQNVVSEAVKTAQSSGPVRILITGHTDTVGSDTYNQALSERRAFAVKGEMIREGMTGDQISTTGKSFHDPLVPTGPGVREPQNRRAVIDLNG